MNSSSILQLHPLSGFDWSSLTGNVASAAAYYSSNYIYAFADAWTFSNLKDYGPESFLTLGQKSVLYNTSYEQILQFAQIHYHIRHYLPAEEALALIRMELAQQRPVLVKGDTFWCPWFPANYRRLHRPNFYLITGYDDLSHDLLCTDVAYGTYRHPQSISDFSLGFAGEVMTLRSADDPYESALELPDLYSILFRRAACNLGLAGEHYSIFDSMRYMADHFEELDDMAVQQQYVEGADTMNRLNLELLYVIQSRMQFVHLLNQQRDPEDHVMQQFTAALNQSVHSWSLIRAAYTKSFEPRMQRHQIVKAIPTQIRLAAALEEDTAQAIMHVKQLHQVSEVYQQRTAKLPWNHKSEESQLKGGEQYNFKSSYSS